MKAVILAAGRGTRMGNLTTGIPKPMLHVRGQPILQHIVRGLAETGMTRFCIVVGWHGEIIRSHFGDGTGLGVHIEYAIQKVQDGTGRAAVPARSFVADDAFLLTYGDILVKPATYARMLERFAAGSFGGLVTVTRGADVTKGGLNLFDDSFCLERILEKPTLAQIEELRRQGRLREGDPVWYNAGIYIFRPLLFLYADRLQKSPRGEYELTDALNAMTADHLRIAGLEIEGRWVDVRDPGVLAELEKGSP